MAIGIKYVVGDATLPDLSSGRNVVVAHCCNDIGAWGSGFVLAISRRWPKVEAAYRELFSRKTRLPYGLGQTQLVEAVKPDSEHGWPGVTVANMIAQRGIGRGGRGVDGEPLIRYDAVSRCLSDVAKFCHGEGGNEIGRAGVHAPRFGCGLAGGAWHKIEPLIAQHLVEAGIPVTIYDLPEAGHGEAWRRR